MAKQWASFWQYARPRWVRLLIGNALWWFACWFVLPHCPPWVGAGVTALALLGLGYVIGRQAGDNKHARELCEAREAHIHDLKAMVALFTIARRAGAPIPVGQIESELN